MNNQIISKWYYGQVREVESIFGIEMLEYQDVNGPESWRWVSCDDFEGDPGAWTQELYRKIEVAGLWVSFKHELWQIFIAHEWTEHQRKVTTGDTVRATPEQKAEALARAIKGAQ